MHLLRDVLEELHPDITAYELAGILDEVMFILVEHLEEGAPWPDHPVKHYRCLKALRDAYYHFAQHPEG